jgi:hypothetical protein
MADGEEGDDSINFHDMLELLDDPDALGCLSPRMLEACFKEGIDPAELLPKSASDFTGNPSTPVPERFQKSRAARHEAHRCLKVRDVLSCRQQLSRSFTSADEAAMTALQAEMDEAKARYAAEEAAAHHRRESRWVASHSISCHPVPPIPSHPIPSSAVPFHRPIHPDQTNTN